MDIGERIANRNFMVDNNKYDNGGSFGKYIFNGGFVSSSIDNLVINSSGKRNGLPFLTALKNGGHYQNNTFFGGNFILGDGFFNKVPIISMKNNSPTRFLSDKSIFGYKPQYYNAKSTETMFTDDMLKGIGGDKDFVIQSGLGFAKDYRGFFQTLDKQGFSVANTESAVDNLPIGGKHDLKEYYEHGTKLDKETAVQYKELVDEKNVLNNEKVGLGKQRTEIGKSKSNSSNKKRRFKKNKNRTMEIDGEIGEVDKKIDDVLKGNTKEIDYVENATRTVNMTKDELLNHIGKSTDTEVLDLAKNSTFGKKTQATLNAVDAKDLSKITRYTKGGINNTINTAEKIKIYDDVAQKLGKVKKAPLEQNGLKRSAKTKVEKKGDVKRIDKNKVRKLSLSEFDDLNTDTSMGDKVKKVNEWLETAKNGKINKATEAGEVINATIEKVYAGKEGIINNADDLAKTLRTDLIDDIGKEFFKTSGLQKLFSNKYIQLATGNYVSGAVAMPLAVVTGLISAGAVSHQEESINNFRGMFSYDSTPVLDYHSEEALRTSYQHQNLSTSNEQDIQYIKTNKNVAYRYANDITPIEIDKKATSLSSFTTI